RELAGAGEPASLWIVTRDAFARDGRANAQADAIWSFGRVVMNEYPAIDVRLLDVAGAMSAADAAGQVTAVIARAGDERELLISQDGIRAPRVAVARPLLSSGAPDGRVRLETRSGAGFEQFAWQWAERRAPAEGEIEIAVEAT